MKAYNKLSAVLLLSAGAFCHQALADNAVFTSMDDPSTAKKPFEGSAAAGGSASAAAVSVTLAAAVAG